MRATTRSTWYDSRAMRAHKMLELSPFVTDASAPAFSMPAAARWSRSKPNPCTVVPLNPAGRRRNARPFLSMTATVWPASSSALESSLPTRPHPMTTTCTRIPPTAERRRMLRPRLAERHTRVGLISAPRAHPTDIRMAPGLRLRAWRYGWRGEPVTPGHGTEFVFDTLKRIFVGRPLATSEQEHQRIPKVIALAVFSSDAISSTAYATEEILFVTVVGTSSLALGLNVLVPISIAVAILLAIVATSYRQTIFAYPSGGGSYVVSRENLGENPSLVAGASLLVDYILTVAVSISAGVAAIVSIPQFESLANYRVELGLALIFLITVANLRGIKESGRLFAFPTYLYIVVLTALVVLGLSKSLFGWFGGISTIPYDPA